MLLADKVNLPKFTPVKNGSLVGIETTFGRLSVDTHTQEWTLLDKGGKKLTGGKQVAEEQRGNYTTVTMEMTAEKTERFYSSGATYSSADSLHTVGGQPAIDDQVGVVPGYYSTAGYSLLAVSTEPSVDGARNLFPANWSASSTASSKGQASVTWRFLGDKAEVHLSPAATPADAIKATWAVTGMPVLPPRYAFGFLASRAGWGTADAIETALGSFANFSLPIDAVLAGARWFSDVPESAVGVNGSDGYTDFGFSESLFPQPAEQLERYRQTYGVVFGGNRQPRLGNTSLVAKARSSPFWLQPDSRNMNFSTPALRQWYSSEQRTYREDGVEFFWNDDVGTDYFTAHYWAQAERDGLAAFNKTKRFFGINTGFTPGMQRFGVAARTGQVPASWDSLERTPGFMLNWVMAGAPFVTCDIGGFQGMDASADLVVRWYQVGAFMPVMRVHSNEKAQAHFPYLYDDQSSSAMAAAMDLRYSLVPLIYSLTHEMLRTGLPVFRPLVMEFPEDVAVHNLVDQWLVGGSLMVAPVMNSRSSRAVYLPEGTWCSWSTVKCHSGPTTLPSQVFTLRDIPMFARVPSMAYVAPMVKNTHSYPGGVLQVRVYPGADINSTMYEDDGESVAYQSGDSRKSLFQWTEDDATFVWQVTGPYSSPETTFDLIQVLLHVPNKPVQQSVVRNMGKGGDVVFPAYRAAKLKHGVIANSTRPRVA